MTPNPDSNFAAQLAAHLMARSPKAAREELRALVGALWRRLPAQGLDGETTCTFVAAFLDQLDAELEALACRTVH